MNQKTLFADDSIVSNTTSTKTKRIIHMDGGERKSSLKVWDSATQTEYELTLDEYIEMLTLDSFQGVRFDEYDKTYITSELAHWLLQTEFSLAQIFTEEEMTQIINHVNNNDSLVLAAWSEKMTTSALKLYKRPDGKDGLKDFDDCAAIAHYIEYHNYYDNLKKIKSISDLKPNDIIAIGNDYRKNHWNKDMNKAQKVNYGLPKKKRIYQDLDMCPVMRDIILPNWKYLEENLPIQLKKLWMGNMKGQTWQELYEKNKTLANFPEEHKHIKEYRHLIEVIVRTQDSKSGEFKKGDVDIIDWIPQMRGFYTAFNGIFDYTGQLRKHPMASSNQKFVTNKWLHDHYMVDKAHHQQGGVGRAVMYYYVFPQYVASKYEEIHGKGTWPKSTTTYKCPHDEKQKKNKRHNRGSLTREQDRFFTKSRTEIRKLVRDYIWNVFRDKYSNT
tara:strand:- start:63 stop:1391 length:1329 start_codon:yes stop_codon:yes gene_type:complete